MYYYLLIFIWSLYLIYFSINKNAIKFATSPGCEIKQPDFLRKEKDEKEEESGKKEKTEFCKIDT
jgi:hypothetical protein